MMMQLMETMAFSGAGAAAGWTLWSSVGPQWQRIVRLALGRPDPMFSPLGQLVLAERRIAVRDRLSVSRSAQPWRAAA